MLVYIASKTDELDFRVYSPESRNEAALTHI